MENVKAAVDVLGLDPVSTAAKSTNEVSPSKAKGQVSSSLSRSFASSHVILHNVVILDTHARFVNQHNLPA